MLSESGLGSVDVADLDCVFGEAAAYCLFQWLDDSAEDGDQAAAFGLLFSFFADFVDQNAFRVLPGARREVMSQ